MRFLLLLCSKAHTELQPQSQGTMHFHDELNNIIVQMAAIKTTIKKTEFD